MTANDMEEPSAPLPMRPRDVSSISSASLLSGLSKSDSNASASAQSFKSHASIPVIGAHPYGTLRVHQPSDSPHSGSGLSRKVLMKPLPDDPPPLLEPDGMDMDGGAGQGLELDGDGSQAEDEENDAEGDMVLVLDLPQNFTAGYDSVSFTTRNFHGVRDIPPGAHFFWASETEASTTRSGFWIITSTKGSGNRKSRAQQVHVVQWDRFNEVLGPPASQTEARIQRANIQTTYPRLAPYQYRAANVLKGSASSRSLNASPNSRSSRSPEPVFAKNTNIWQQLTCCISGDMLDRVTGRRAEAVVGVGGGGGGSHGEWAVHTSDRVRGAAVLPAEAELDRRLPSSVVVAGSELRFAFSQTAKTYDVLTLGAARTEQAVDATSHIASLLDSQVGPDGGGLSEDDLVGELQFAFVVGMHLGNEPCIQQWWHVVLRLVFRAYSLVVRRPRLARLFLQTITAQLVYNDRYLDGSILDYDYAAGGGSLDGLPSGSSSGSGKNDLRLALIVYKRRLNELLLGLNSRATPEQAAVGQAFSELEAWVWKLGWDIRSDYLRAGKTMLEDGEEVEVEMDELEAEDERGEYAAVVVDIDEQGRQKDLVSWN